MGEIGHLDDFGRLVPPPYGSDVVSDFFVVDVLGVLHCAPWKAKIKFKKQAALSLL